MDNQNTPKQCNWKPTWSKPKQEIFDTIWEWDGNNIKEKIIKKLTNMMWFTSWWEEFAKKITQEYSPEELNEMFNNIEKLDRVKKLLLIDFLKREFNLYSKYQKTNNIKKIIYNLLNNIPIDGNLTNIICKRACTSTYTFFSQALKNWTLTIDTIRINGVETIVLWKYRNINNLSSRHLLIDPFNDKMNIYGFETDNFGKIIWTQIAYDLDQYKKEIWEEEFEKEKEKLKELKKNMINLIEKYYPEMLKNKQNKEW